MPGHVICLFKVTSPVVAEDEELNQLQARSCLCGTYVRQLTTQLSYTYIYIYLYTHLFLSLLLNKHCWWPMLDIPAFAQHT